MNYVNIEDLKNYQFNRAKISNDKTCIVLETNKDSAVVMSWHGDCCSSCFIESIQGADNLLNSTIISANHKEWTETSFEIFDDYDRKVESMGTTIKTTKGYVDINTRLEHNGYYSGYIEIYETDIDFTPDYDFTELRDF